MGHVIVLLAERNLTYTVDEGAVLVHGMVFRETEGLGVVVDRAEALVAELLCRGVFVEVVLRGI